MDKITFEQIKLANDCIKTTDIKGKDYAEVNQRIKAFRMVYPLGSISTNIVSLEDGVVTMKATVTDEDGRLLGTGYAQEKESSSFINKTSFIENCETSAVGRALGMCGFGIDTSIASYEEVQNAINNQGDKKSNKTKEVDTNQVLVDYATVKATMDSYGIDFREKLNDNILKATKLPTQDITQLDPQQIATLVKYYNALVKKFKQQKGV